MKQDDDELRPSDWLTEDTIRRADEMYKNLSEQELRLDRRGEAVFYHGAFTDLASVAQREFMVTVADLRGQPWLTLISELQLPKTEQGLLVFKIPPAEGRRYLGRVQKSRPGLRGTDDAGQFFAIFDIVRDARR